MSDAFVMNAETKLTELQPALPLQPAVTDAETDGVTDAELNAFTKGLDILAESHMATSHSRSNRPPIGIRSQAQHVADVPEHGRKDSLSNPAAGTSLASVVVSHLRVAHFLFCYCPVITALSFLFSLVGVVSRGS